MNKANEKLAFLNIVGVILIIKTSDKFQDKYIS